MARQFLYLLILLLGSIQVVAQDLTNQTNLYVPEDMEFYVDGHIVNEGFLQNKGSIDITGDWSNKQVYQGNGKVILHGGSDQHIFNNRQQISHLVMSGEGNKYIDDKIIVTNQLDLLQGIVFVNDEDTLLLEENAVVTIGSLNSYIDGALTVTGVGYKFFPIGKNGKYHPIEYLDVKGINPVLEVELFEDLPPVKAPYASNLYRSVFWQRKDVHGKFISSAAAFGYTIDPDQLNHIVIASGDDTNHDFSVIENVIVQTGDQMDKVSSETELTARIMVLGQSDAGYGANPEKQFYISTSLSPHASQEENRYIKVFGNGLSDDQFIFQVFNRWGLKIYENTSLDAMSSEGWDGRQTDSGNLLPSGAYPFVLKAVQTNGKIFEKQGIISIMN